MATVPAARMVPVPADWRIITRSNDGQKQYVNMGYVVRIVLNGAGGSTLFFGDGTSTEVVELPEILTPVATQSVPEPEPAITATP